MSESQPMRAEELICMIADGIVRDQPDNEQFTQDVVPLKDMLRGYGDLYLQEEITVKPESRLILADAIDSLHEKKILDTKERDQALGSIGMTTVEGQEPLPFDVSGLWRPRAARKVA